MKAIYPITPILRLAMISSVSADHNSPWGEGWANTPNDVHNTRIDTRDDNEAFRDFVRQSNGASSVNRFSDSTITNQRGGRFSSGGSRGFGGAGGRR